MKLLFCCGSEIRHGWKRLDAQQKYHPDFLATVPPLPPEVRRIAWTEIEWIHGICTFFEWQARETLRELHSILSPGGRLILEQPDMDICCEAWLRGERRYHWGLYGDHSFSDPLHTNKFGWNPRMLIDALVEAGFAAENIFVDKARYHQPDRDFRVEAIR